MFEVFVGNDHYCALREFQVILENCPAGGIAAVDFRRAQGLPEAATNEIELPHFKFTDEEFCRQLADSCGTDANLHLAQQVVPIWAVNKNDGQSLMSRSPLSMITNTKFVVQPVIVRQYLLKQTPETAKALIFDILDYSPRNKAEVQAKVNAALAEKKAKEDALDAARELLKDEISRMEKKIAYLEGDLEDAKERIAQLEPEVVED